MAAIRQSWAGVLCVCENMCLDALLMVQQAHLCRHNHQVFHDQKHGTVGLALHCVTLEEEFMQGLLLISVQAMLMSFEMLLVGSLRS